MQVFKSKVALSDRIENLKSSGKSVGLVPTMGALHNGHLSLVKKAKEECDIVVVSIFVNPTQFNDPNDLKRYPRTLDADVKLLESVGCDLVLAPAVDEMYPEPDNRKFDFGYIEKIMEGPSRPGHFNGVAQIVSKLFTIVKPHKAFFGMKDFQQIAVIRSMVSQLHFNIEIIACPIIRESDGLAMSSRNTLLEKEYRKVAPEIYASLCKAKDIYETKSVTDLKKWVSDKIDSNGLLKTEYVEIVDEMSLKLTEKWSEPGHKVICVAVQAGKIRLIDNIVL